MGWCWGMRIGTRSIFAKLLCTSGTEVGFVELIQELAGKRLADVPQAKTFIDLAMAYELDRARHNWREPRINGLQADILGRSFKVPAKLAWDNVGIALHTGIGFGSRYPEQTERLWKNEHEYSLSDEQWHAAKTRGVIRADEVMEKDMTLAEKQVELVARVEAFVSNYHPEFLSALRASLGRSPIDNETLD